MPGEQFFTKIRELGLKLGWFRFEEVMDGHLGELGWTMFRRNWLDVSDCPNPDTSYGNTRPS